ncbi:MAG: hypothetical protein U0793_15230 [Gemmataceae bacterium]
MRGLMDLVRRNDRGGCLRHRRRAPESVRPIRRDLAVRDPQALYPVILWYSW